MSPKANTVDIDISQYDIDHAWNPCSESARLYHSPINSAITKAFSLQVATRDYSKVGPYYFDVNDFIFGHRTFDVVEVNDFMAWNRAWDRGEEVLPCTFHAIETTKPPKKGFSAHEAGDRPPRRYGGDIESRKLGSD
jgi:hypothetical protein